MKANKIYQYILDSIDSPALAFSRENLLFNIGQSACDYIPDCKIEAALNDLNYISTTQAKCNQILGILGIWPVGHESHSKIQDG
jgi:hypothetical protein